MLLFNSPEKPLSSSSLRLFAQLILGSKTSCHLLQHCTFVRPGTIAASAFQSLPPCVSTAPLSLLSSSSVQLLLRLIVRSLLQSKISCVFVTDLHLHHHYQRQEEEDLPKFKAWLLPRWDRQRCRDILRRRTKTPGFCALCSFPAHCEFAIEVWTVDGHHSLRRYGRFCLVGRILNNDM
jgi:hypothetical protein